MDKFTTEIVSGNDYEVRVLSRRPLIKALREELLAFQEILEAHNKLNLSEMLSEISQENLLDT